MSAARSADVPEIRRGRIYQDVYRKRVDTQLVTSTAALERARIEGDCLIFEGTTRHGNGPWVMGCSSWPFHRSWASGAATHSPPSSTRVLPRRPTGVTVS